MKDRLGAKRLTRADIAELVRDERVWCGVAVVVKRDGESSHYEITSSDVFVEVDLMPSNIPLTCRLAAAAGGPGSGLWRVPPVGAEVAVCIPGGELEAEAMIVGVLSSGTAPSGLDADTMVLINPKNVVIRSDNGDVSIDAHGKVHLQTSGGGAQPIARKSDPVNVGSFWIQGIGTAFAGITWFPPGGGSPVSLPVNVSPVYDPTKELTGEVKDGSSNADCG